MQVLRKLKDFLYTLLVETNPYIKAEYQGKIDENPQTHKKHRLRSWLRLIGLNIKYRILRKKSPEENIPKKNVPGKNAPRVELSLVEGSESKLSVALNPVWVIKSLLKRDVIVFSVFDLLIYRPFLSTSDLFIKLCEKHSMFSFRELRIQAQKEAMQTAREATGYAAISIYDIYKVVEKYSGIPVENGVQAEFEAELECCYANPFMLQTYEMLVENGACIVFYANTYWPESFLHEILMKAGYGKYDRLYVAHAGETGTEKIFSWIQDDYSVYQSFAYIDWVGKNLSMAKNMGWSAYTFKNPSLMGKAFRAPGLTHPFSSMYAGVVNAYLHNGLNAYSPEYEFGFIYGGVFVMGYCQWLHDHCMTYGFDKVLFLSGEGEILKKVYDFMYDDIPSEYVFWSERMATDALGIVSLYPIIDYYVTRKALSKKIDPHYSLRDCLIDIKLSLALEDLSFLGLNPKLPLAGASEAVLSRFIEFIEMHYDTIKQYSSDNANIIIQYIVQIIGDSKKIAVADVNWRRTDTASLQYIIQNLLHSDCEVTALLATKSSTTLVPGRVTSPVSSNRMPAYKMPAYIQSRDFISNRRVFDLMLGATHPRVLGFEKNEGMPFIKFDMLFTENHGIARSVQQGILAFVNEYISRFPDFDSYFISGEDVGRIAGHIASHKSYLNNVFKDYYIYSENEDVPVPFPKL